MSATMATRRSAWSAPSRGRASTAGASDAGRLVVDVTYSRCNDAMSGKGYEHRVTVTADGGRKAAAASAGRNGSL